VTVDQRNDGLVLRHYLPLTDEIKLKIDGSPDYPDFLDSLSSDGDSVYLNGRTTYPCEMCHKFQEDSKAMRQRIAGHDLQSANNWIQRYKVLKPDFPCILCGIRDSHATNPGKDTSTMPGCYMWLESRGSQPTHDRRLVRR
jgi:hypothetical protein